MNSSQITSVLASQHSNDVFVSECKDGPTWFGGHARMDAWTMNRSWSRLCVTGYEIKVSKRDFQQDKKWHTYLPLCNQLYFVCPKGMIEAHEIPKGVGLKYCTDKQARTIVKAEHREVVIPQELFFYLLMCRTRVVDANYHEPESRAKKIERLRLWAKEKVETRDLGYEVGRAVSETFNKIKCDNIRLKSENEQLSDIKRFAKELGVSSWMSEQSVKDKISEFKSSIPSDFLPAMRALRSSLNDLMDKFDK